MNAVSLFENEQSAAEKTMTTKELANVLGVSSDSILLAVKRLNLAENIRKVPINGKMRYVFTAAQSTAIKIELQNHSKVAQNGFTTLTISNDLEMFMVQKQLDAYKDRRIAELTAQNEQLKIENAEAKPKAEYYDALIERRNSTNIRNTAKELGLPEKQFIKQLQLDRFLYRDKHNQLCPYAEYVQKGYFEMKEWQHGQKSGIQTLITVTGKQYFIGKYEKVAIAV